MNPQVDSSVQNPLLARVKIPGRIFQLPSCEHYFI